MTRSFPSSAEVISSMLDLHDGISLARKRIDSSFLHSPTVRHSAQTDDRLLSSDISFLLKRWTGRKTRQRRSVRGCNRRLRSPYSSYDRW
jgi:hypothetical protein